jgi:hypothetical protein
MEAYGPSLCPFLTIHTFLATQHTHQAQTPRTGWRGGLPKNIAIKNNNFVNIFYEMYYMICPAAEITTEIC